MNLSKGVSWTKYDRTYMSSRVSVTQVTLSNQVLVELINGVHEKGAVFKFRAAGRSMYPTIRSGDTITISPLKNNGAIIGSVAAFLHPGSDNLVVHRIVKKKDGKFLCRGDNLLLVDGWVSADKIVGIISSVERGGRSVFWPYANRYMLMFSYPAFKIFSGLRKISVRIYRKLLK